MCTNPLVARVNIRAASIIFQQFNSFIDLSQTHVFLSNRHMLAKLCLLPQCLEEVGLSRGSFRALLGTEALGDLQRRICRRR